jgi:lysophospholipase L1-like esterase
MKSILCFGDSLTWGSDPVTALRHPFESRWPNVLAARLDNQVRVIEEGMNGRTTVYDDPTVDVNRNGAALLPSLLMTHQPLDMVILALGTNDIKFAGRCTAFDATLGMKRLITMVQRFDYKPGYRIPKIMIVAPPLVIPTADPFFTALFGHTFEQTRQFASLYAELAAEMGVAFFDGSKHAVAHPADGVHLDAENTVRLGEGMAAPVRKVLGL